MPITAPTYASPKDSVLWDRRKKTSVGVIIFALVIILCPVVWAIWWELSHLDPRTNDMYWRIQLAMGWNEPIDIAVNQNDVDILVRTIIGEAGNQSTSGQIAVAHVIFNRVRGGRHGGRTIRNVALWKYKRPNGSVLWQFETWMNRDRRIQLLSISKTSSQYIKVFELVRDTILGRYADNTEGSLYYLQPEISMKRHGYLPHCKDKNNRIRIGDHVFCRSL